MKILNMEEQEKITGGFIELPNGNFLLIEEEVQFLKNEKFTVYLKTYSEYDILGYREYIVINPETRRSITANQLDAIFVMRAQLASTRN